jgi:excisionase family DNA binding protein
MGADITLKTMQQYSEDSGIPVGTLLRWIEDEGMPAKQLGRTVLLSPWDVREWWLELNAKKEAGKSKERRGSVQDAAQRPDPHGEAAWRTTPVRSRDADKGRGKKRVGRAASKSRKAEGDTDSRVVELFPSERSDRTA